jgi:hypothetical protein
MRHETGMFILRMMLIIWLAMSVDGEDDLYGVLSSIRRLQECKKLVTIQ